MLFSRYADIVVHRLLASSLGIDPLPAAVQDRTRVHDMAEVINHRHRMAQLVSRASNELFTLLYFQGKDVQEDAMVVAVKANGIRVMVPRFGIEAGITLWTENKFDEEVAGAVDAATAPAAKNPWRLDEAAMSLSGPNGVSYKIFEQVRVRIFVQEAKSRRKWLQIELLDKVATSRPTEQIVKHLQTNEAAAATAAASAARPVTNIAASAASSAAPATGKKSKKRELDEDEETSEDKPTSAAAAAPTASASKKKAASNTTAAKPEAGAAAGAAKKKQKL